MRVARARTFEPIFVRLRRGVPLVGDGRVELLAERRHERAEGIELFAVEVVVRSKVLKVEVDPVGELRARSDGRARTRIGEQCRDAADVEGSEEGWGGSWTTRRG